MMKDVQEMEDQDALLLEGEGHPLSSQPEEQEALPHLADVRWISRKLMVVASVAVVFVIVLVLRRDESSPRWSSHSPASKSVLLFSMHGSKLTTTKCPGSEAQTHAGMKLATIADASCSDVAAEAKARVAGKGGWVDPHNQGAYTTGDYGGTMSFKRRTGDDKFTDAMVFTLTDTGGKCKIDACSESQGDSWGDFSTNYCNLEMLFCGSTEGCKPVLHDFTHGSENLTPMAGASSTKADCFGGPQAR
mmetsp:Transcript_35128/g.62099  ORF Transcript_35128/g.62099 Transcript_35128/m.62099 type:complete len:247 (+) Transcript_35128:53-793(+)